MNRDDFRGLARDRIEDACVLLRNDRHSAAYYLCGYAVECGLKACIAKQTKEFDFPPEPKAVRGVYVHNLETLLGSAGLESQLKADLKSDRELEANWAVAKDWDEGSRYTVKTKRDADDLFEAVSDSKHGVLRWISRHW